MNSPAAYGRVIYAGWVLLREGVIASLPTEGLWPPLTTLHALAIRMTRRSAKASSRRDRFVRALEKLGPSYVKLGQFLATRPDVVGTEVALDLSALQDEMETFATAIAIAEIQDSLGRPLADLYSRFDEPIAAASIAQVHPAEIQVHPAEIRNAPGEREKVAVKVIRPGIRRRFQRDLQTFYLVAHLQERFVPGARRLRPVEVTRTLEQTTKIEMDLRLEAAALSELGENTQNDPGFRVPRVDWERTGRDVMTMEWIDGIKMSDIAGLKAAGHDLDNLANVLIQSFLRHTLRDGFFHADMHQGNLFVDAQGTIVAVDMGIVGRLGKRERRFLAEILFGFIRRDYQRVAEVHFEAGYVPAYHSVASFAQALRAIGEPIHGQSAETISMARLLTLLFEVTELFEMQTRPELIMLQKTMVVVEGVSRSLNPRFNMWKAAEPVVSEWIRHNLGPAHLLSDARDGLKALVHLAEQAPDLAARAEVLSRQLEVMAEEGLRLDDATTQKIGAATARRGSAKLALWILAVAAVVIAWQLG